MTILFYSVFMGIKIINEANFYTLVRHQVPEQHCVFSAYRLSHCAFVEHARTHARIHARARTQALCPLVDPTSSPTHLQQCAIICEQPAATPV